MGCDIHIRTEVRTTGGQWRINNRKVFKNRWYKPDAKYDWEQDEYTPDPDDGRNYMLFSFLADVRNYHDQPIVPIAEPRGVPDDATQDWLDEVEDWGFDMHSTSYFTLRELEDADWGQEVTYGYYVNPKAYKKWKKDGEEPEYSWGGGSGTHVTAEEYEKLPAKEKNEVRGIRIQFTKTIGDILEDWKRDTLDGLRRLTGDLTSPDDVRIVFGFDN